MMTEDQLVRICTQCLNHNVQGGFADVGLILVNPLNYSFLLRVMSNTYVAFMFCLNLKKTLRNNRDQISLTRHFRIPTFGNIDYEVEQMQQIARSTYLYQRINLAILKSKKSPKHQILTGNSQNQNCWNTVTSQIFQNGQYSDRWYGNIIFINLLLYSMSSTAEMPSNEQQIKWQRGLRKLRNEVYSALLMEILLQLTSHQSHCQAVLQMMVKQSSQMIKDSAKALQREIFIIDELIGKLNDLQQLIIVKRFNNSYGRKIIDIINRSLVQLIESLPLSADVAIKALIVVNELLYMSSKSKEDKMLSIIAEVCDIDQADVKSRPRLPDWLTSFNNDLITYIKTINSLVPLQHKRQTMTISLEILEKITYNSCLKQCQIPTKDNFCSNSELKMADCIKSLLNKWQYLPSVGSQGNQFYLQSIFIDVLQNLYNNNLGFILQHKEFTDFILRSFSLQIINKIPIQISMGDLSPHCKLFYFLQKIRLIGSKIMKDQQIIEDMKQVVDLFINRLNYPNSKEIFTNFNQQLCAISDFFTPIVQFIDKLYSLKDDRLDFNNHFIKIQSLMEKLQIKQGGLIVLFSLQLVKNIEFSNTCLSRSDNKCKLILFLLQFLKDSRGIEYLMLFDIVIDQIINQQQQLASSSYLWFYINKNTEWTFQSFLCYVSQQIISFLQTNNSIYFATYSIHLLAKMCSKVDTRQKVNFKMTENRIKQYLHPIVNLIQFMDMTCLQNVQNYEQRTKLFQLFGVVMIRAPEDVNKIYRTIQKSLFLSDKFGKIRYFIDLIGLLNLKLISRVQQVLIQLIFIELSGCQDALSIFSADQLQTQQTFFSIFANFLSKILLKMARITLFHPTNHNSILMLQFHLIFKDSLDVLGQIYNCDNFETITQLYLSYTRISGFVNIFPIQNVSSFPAIPHILYSSSLTRRLIAWIFNNLHRISSEQQIKNLFQNVFNRKLMDFEEEIELQLREELAQTTELPKYLFLLFQYMNQNELALFFDFKETVKKILIRLYKNYQDKNSSAMTLDSFDFDKFESDEDQGSRPPVNCLDEFVKCSANKLNIKQLARTQFQFQAVYNDLREDYPQYEKKFFSDAKEMLDHYSF